MQKFPTNRLLCLDFDGVLCDSVMETGISGWKTGCKIWADWTTPEPPDATLQAFRRLRPLLHTGFESVLLMRIAFEQPNIDVPDEMEIQRLYDKTLDSSNLSKQELIDVFGKTRDEWITNDPADWLSKQQLYPGIADALKASLACPTDHVHIVTTKQERFVRELLKAEDIMLPGHRIHGLESGTQKEITLKKIAADHDESIRRFIVEDRLPTLHKIAATPDLDDFALLYADWGYGHPDDQQAIAKQKRIQIISREDFIGVLGQCEYQL
jgi:phosphoglycolate phosphatase-like HAD superfamily hydrolase